MGAEDICGHGENPVYTSRARASFTSLPGSSTDARRGQRAALTSEATPVLPHTSANSRKRKSTETPGVGAEPKQQKKRAPAKASEKRLRQFRTSPSQAFLTILNRARYQRMFVMDRKQTGTAANPEETVKIAGTTGNLYTVKVNKVPSCDCPHALAGNHCKHIVYVMAKTLKAPDDLQYQVALLTSELQHIFSHAPPLPTEAASSEDKHGIRKPIEDDCPICCVEFDAAKDAIVYCKAACGNNVHKDCFQQWAAQKRQQGSEVTCPFCRTEWEGANEVLPNLNVSSRQRGPDGYINIASQLGISGYRDTASYHQPWVRSERRAGGLADEPPDIGEYYTRRWR